MFLQIILISLSSISLFIISVILLRKIPVLTNLPEAEISKESLFSKIKKGAAKLPGSQKLDYELYLQKMLSKVRVLTLKTESKTGGWLERLRQKRNGHNGHNNDEYWEELKKTKEGK